MTGRPEPQQPGAATGWCDWHRGPSETAVLVDVVEEDSGTASGRYACAPCRQQRGLRPLGEPS